MTILNHLLFPTVLLCATSTTIIVNAFSTANYQISNECVPSRSLATPTTCNLRRHSFVAIPSYPSRSGILMTSDDYAEESSEDAPSEPAEASAESSEEASDETESTEEQVSKEEAAEAIEAEAEEEVVEEDPEMVKLKEDIDELEREISKKRRILINTQDSTDDFSKSGYTRKIAKIENKRRQVDAALKESEAIGFATGVQIFLPILDKLKALNDETYAGNEFASQYRPLYSTFKDMLSGPNGLGCTEIVPVVGNKIDKSSTTSIRQEYSSELAKGTVMEMLKPGLVLKGNVLRFAEVVESLGSEEDLKVSEEAEEVDEEKDDDKAE